MLSLIIVTVILEIFGFKISEISNDSASIIIAICVLSDLRALFKIFGK